MSAAPSYFDMMRELGGGVFGAEAAGGMSTAALVRQVQATIRSMGLPADKATIARMLEALRLGPAAGGVGAGAAAAGPMAMLRQLASPMREVGATTAAAQQTATTAARGAKAEAAVSQAFRRTAEARVGDAVRTGGPAGASAAIKTGGLAGVAGGGRKLWQRLVASLGGAKGKAAAGAEAPWGTKIMKTAWRWGKWPLAMYLVNRLMEDLWTGPEKARAQMGVQQAQMGGQLEAQMAAQPSVQQMVMQALMGPTQAAAQQATAQAAAVGAELPDMRWE